MRRYTLKTIAKLTFSAILWLMILLFFTWNSFKPNKTKSGAKLKVFRFSPHGKAQNALPAVLHVNAIDKDAANEQKKDWHDYKAMERDNEREGLGERGSAAFLNNATLGLEQKMSLENGFNALLSDSISINRSVPDIRNMGCLNKLYLRKLPTVSIIIIFWNEYMSVLMRSVYSLINRSPPELIKEIILVDDGSDRAYLGKPLDDYIADHFTNVHVVRLPRRTGLIMARSAGARNATAEVLIFFDSHIETNYNWLPPLLEPIAMNKRTADEGQRGGFNWLMLYTRLPLLPEDLKHPTEPFKSPVMAGGLFAISSEFFWELGGYDEGLDIWGGEQFELSFKIWMCGGEMYDAPCSRVAHIYRGPRISPPIEKSREKFLLRNFKRVAEVWMDDYKKYLFQHRDGEFDQVDPGDLSAQIAQRYKLKCKSFKWYMENVAFDILKEYPPVEPADYANGAIQNLGDPNICVDTLQHKPVNKPGPYLCAENLVHPQVSQYWALSWRRDLRMRGQKVCLDVQMWTQNTPVWLWQCHGAGGNQYWSYNYNTKLLMHGINQKRCLELLPQTKELVVNLCNSTNKYMHWNFGFVNHTALQTFKTN
ncbi:N-acetylgalactosaminyltransferase 6-like isoform X2 [Scaptodrosophila lebanonensis]|uniref:Polypeptide N-acetylgalactosaminyltransferase n=1 Tax=Drosophila lebanonensis TaxID=7225 RepID=A0A6J2TA71_DROLE|nr:N-acetylgalactosaminyltransferase 6-like isoform X2 [Scaptodrosophila lebanonensis]